MSINRELSQLASFIDVQESNNFIGISTGGTYTVGIGTSSVTISSNGTITAPLFLGATGSSLIDHIDLQDEGSPVGTGFTTLNFVGAAVTITQGVTGVATITVDSAVVGGEDGAVRVRFLEEVLDPNKVLVAGGVEDFAVLTDTLFEQVF